MFTTDTEARAELVHLAATVLIAPSASEKRPELFNLISKITTYRNRPLSEIVTPDEMRLIQEFASAAYDAWTVRNGLPGA